MLPVAINHIHIQGTASVITACFDVNSSITILSQPSVKEDIMKSTDSKKLFFHNKLITLFLIAAICIGIMPDSVLAASQYPVIILTSYNRTLKIGDTFYLAAFTSNGSIPTYKSTSSKIASVTSLGEITAKSPGTCKINVKSKKTEVSCKITVSKTKLVLSKKSVSIEHGENFRLDVKSSTKSQITYKSNKTSVAAVDDSGNITGCKPGDAIITVKADTSTALCKVKVKTPTVKLSHSSLSLYKNQSASIKCEVSSGLAPVWKSNKQSIVSVDENGLVTAHKHGSAVISATVDGVKKICSIEVKSPVIKLNHSSLKLKPGETKTLTASVSSGNAPTWTSKKTSIATINQKGVVKAKKAGTTIITASEDGASASCTVTVTK